MLLGAGCLVIVVLTHVCETFHLFPAMGWGLKHSPGHYLDLSAAILGLTFLPMGFFLARWLGFLKTTSHGFVYFGVVEIHYVHVAALFPAVLIVYYLIWKYLIGFFNRVAGIAG